jgi:Uma2 family endonuclease
MIEVAEEKRLITVEEYYQMAEFGILKPDESVELINGEIIKMSPIKSKHSGHVKTIHRILSKLISDFFIIGVQDPVSLNKYSEPEPDISILELSEHNYIKYHPNADDVVFLIEVSDSTLTYDRTKKARLYAKASIPEYWIINLVGNQLEVYQNPIDGKYTTKTVLSKNDKVKIPNTDIEINVSEIIK